MMKKFLLRITASVAAVLLAASGMTVCAERPEGYDAEGCMPLITEPGDSAEPLIFCRGDEDLTMDEVNWVDDGQGKAVRFNGVDEYFRIAGNSLQATEFTLSMWVKWQGEATDGSELLNQRIFSARGANRDRQYITLSPMESTAEGEDGLRLCMRYGNSEWELSQPQVSPLPQDAWHHLAVVSDRETLSLYLDGVMVDEELTMMSLAQMRLQQLCLGRGPTLGGDGYFNGLMDNVYLYKKVLDADALGTLMEEQRPVEPTTTAPVTTTTTTTQSTPEDIPDVQQVDTSLPTIPPIVWIVTGVVAALIVALIVTENIRYAKGKLPPTE